MNKVVVISAHPDDEIIGVGGTLLRHKKAGDDLIWIIVTAVLETEGFSKQRVASRQAEIEMVSREVGFSKVFQLGYPTMKLDEIPLTGLVQQISTIFSDVKPEIIYCVNRSDAHSDHRFVFEAVMASTKSFRHPYIKQTLMYECLSETEFAPALAERVFLPNYFVDITDFMERKVEILKIYESELGGHPFPRSIENIRALGTFRGATAGVKFAEAFQLIKFVVK